MTAGAVPSQGRPRAHRLIQVFPPSSAPRLVELDRQRVIIGRAAPANFVVDDAHVSRSHAEVGLGPEYGVIRIADAGSKNGTFVDGRRLDGHAEHLKNGSVVRIGDALFTFEAVELPGSVAAEASRDCPLGLSLARFAAELLVDRAAPTALPLLIRGPTGAGKEALARRAHEASGRAGQLVSVNCAAFSRDLLGSELFGHVKGAFSGAVTDRKGLMQLACGGTLFLDEFAEMPMDQQPTLLRALQEQVVRPVGSDDDVSVDFRLVAASHQDLERLEENGRLRGDLLARLAGIVIELPGLAQRKVEILPIFGELLGVSEVEIEVDAAEALLLCSWSKNFRELKRHADTVKLFLGEQRTVDLSMLPMALQSRQAQSKPSSTSREQQLVHLLKEHDGNVASVARAMGEHRQQVYRWLKAYNIEAEQYRGPKKA